MNLIDEARSGESAAGFYYVSDIIFSMFVGDMLLMMAMLLMSNCLISDISPTSLRHFLRHFFSMPSCLNILPSSEKVYPLSSAVAIDFSAFEIAS